MPTPVRRTFIANEEQKVPRHLSPYKLKQSHKGQKKKSPRREKPKACAYSACTKGTLNIYNGFKSMFLSLLPLFLDWAFPVS